MVTASAGVFDVLLKATESLGEQLVTALTRIFKFTLTLIEFAV